MCSLCHWRDKQTWIRFDSFSIGPRIILIAFWSHLNPACGSIHLNLGLGQGPESTGLKTKLSRPEQDLCRCHKVYLQKEKPEASHYCSSQHLIPLCCFHSTVPATFAWNSTLSTIYILGTYFSQFKYMLFRILKINIILENVKNSKISLKTTVICDYVWFGWLIRPACTSQKSTIFD